jgi:hypothetical protein
VSDGRLKLSYCTCFPRDPALDHRKNTMARGGGGVVEKTKGSLVGLRDGGEAVSEDGRKGRRRRLAVVDCFAATQRTQHSA